MPRFIVSLMVCCLLLMASFSPGRCEDFNDVVYLKNGSVIKGIIVEQVLGKSIKIQTRDGSLFVFKYEEVEKIGKQVSEEGGDFSGGTSHKPIKYQNNTTFNIALPFSDAGTGDAKVGLTTVNGVRFGDVFALGLGAGYLNYSDDTGYGTGTSYLPIFLDARAYVPNAKIEPYFFGKIGYGFFLFSDPHLSSYNYSGLLFGFGAGFQVSLYKNFCFIFDVSFDIQNYSISYYPGYTFSGQVNFLRFSPGFAF
jgi:hypothetical protein